MSLAKRFFASIVSGVRKAVPFSEIWSSVRGYGDDSDYDEVLAAYHDIAALNQYAKIIKDAPNDTILGNDLSVESPWFWKRQYVLRAKVQGYDRLTASDIEQWITVESDNALSKNDWHFLIQRASNSLFNNYDIVINDILEYELLRRQL